MLTRLMTEANQSVYDSMDYLPFGEQEAGGSGTSHKFTGYERDSESGNDYAIFRHYGATHANFLQPDPYNFGANVTNPQTWNGYAYVLNNPLMFIDPMGLNCVWDDGSYDSNDDPDTGTPEKCAAEGGTWVDEGLLQDDGYGDWSSSPDDFLSGLVVQIQNTTPSAYVTATALNNDPSWLGAFLGSFFSPTNIVQADVGAWKDGYYKCIAKKMIDPSAVAAKGGELAVSEGLQNNQLGRTLAGTYFHFTDARFTAWGSSSNVLVPEAAANIGKWGEALGGVGWLATEGEAAYAEVACTEVLQ